MKTIKISRAKWLRAEGASKSRLFRADDKKYCCLGTALEQCGVDRSLIENKQCPEELAEHIPQSLEWLEGYFHFNNRSKDCARLMTANDFKKSTDQHKESIIKKYFAKHNMKVVFTK